jgi:hypothetical protein
MCTLTRKHRRSARLYTMFSPTQLLRNWQEQRPSKKKEIDSSATREVGRDSITRCGPASDFIFVPQYVIFFSELLLKLYLIVLYCICIVLYCIVLKIVKVNLSRYAMHAPRGGGMYSSYSFLTSALDGVSDQHHVRHYSDWATPAPCIRSYEMQRWTLLVNRQEFEKRRWQAISRYWCSIRL